jgi:adenylate cyclase
MVLHSSPEQLFGLAIALVAALVVLLVAFRSQVRRLVNEQLTSVRLSESRILEVTAAISEELQLGPLLHRVMDTINEILGAERSTLFLHDPERGQLWSNVATGMSGGEIRFPEDAGIAGAVFTTGETINIRDAYSDERFNREVDRKTGFHTRSILCMQIQDREGRAIGVVQVLNKIEGVFTALDERRLRAFSAQVAIAIQNAQLFEEVWRIKSYNEAILESMSNGVLTVSGGRVASANAAALGLLGVRQEALVGREVDAVFGGENAWLARSVARVLDNGEHDLTSDEGLSLPLDSPGASSASVNAAVHPLSDARGGRIGCLVMLEDITTEKRLRTTMARYMTKEVADKLLSEGEDALGGTLQEATVLFSDIRAFTTFSERNGPTETVAMLNGYFTLMVDCIMSNQGILDKYIGDAIMAVFGAPFSGPRDADNALTAAIEMFRVLEGFNARRAAEGRDRVDIGVGLSTDEVVSGNIGSERRMDYTVIGDGVNLAARLEGATKVYGARVLLSEFTVTALSGDYALRPVDLLRVKGKRKPVAVYEALDAWPEPPSAEALAAYAAARERYLAGDFAAAAVGFREALALRPGDRVCELYLERCAAFQEAPPPPAWDGVFEMSTK